VDAGQPRLRLGRSEQFRHFGSGKRLFKAGREQPKQRARPTRDDRRLEDLARAELSRLQAARKLDAFRLETVVRSSVGTFIGFMDWWMREENEHLPASRSTTRSARWSCPV
jgi:hypothetical protein